MSTILKDVSLGLRILGRSPWFTTVAALTLALGIAANTTVFSWIDSVLLRPLPGVSDGQRLIMLETVAPSGDFMTTSYRDYRDYRDSLKQVSGTAASLMNAFTVGRDENAQRIWGEYVSGNYFAVLGVKPIRGRVFLPEEAGDAPGGHPVAVISHRLWSRLFHADPGVVGKTIRVNRYELTIVGVAPADFCGAVPGLSLEVWLPAAMAPQLNGQGEGILASRESRQFVVTARLKPGVSIDQARAEVVARSRQLAQIDPQANDGFSATVLPISKGHFGTQSLLLAPLQILMAVCLVLFLIVCANVANLQLARSITRQKEFSIRLALGAGPGRLVRQLLTESLLLAGMGALAGLLLTQWMGSAVSWLFPPISLPVGLDVKINADILGFTILMCVAAALVSGVLPALYSIRPDVNRTLKEGGRSVTSSAHSHRLRGLLVVSEVALALVALVGTGLFARSFQNARSIYPGFEARNVLLSQFYVATFCQTADQREQFCLRLRDRLASAPGITGVSYSDYIPLGFGTVPWSDIHVEGYLPGRSEDMRIAESAVAPGYFNVMRIPLLEGRDFTERDDRGATPVVIVNQAFAQRFFSAQNPIGRKLLHSGAWFTVVGLAKDSKYHTPTEAPRPYFYTSIRQTRGEAFWIAFFIRTAGPPNGVVATVRREAIAIDPNAGAFDALPLQEYMGSALFSQRVAASLLSVLGAMSILLAAVGLYSVMAYAVSQRTQEFGIRVALGARPWGLLGMVVRQGMVLAVAGLVIGTLAALAAARLVAGMLVNVSASDPLTFVSAAAFLALVAALASYLPALRAMRVDPVVALRNE